MRKYSWLWLCTALGCDTLWGTQIRDNPDNCLQRPGICSAEQICDTPSERCVDKGLFASVEPARGPDSGGVDIALRGDRFVSGMTVIFDGKPVPATVISERELRVSLPGRPRYIGPATITVRFPSGVSSTRDDLFSYYLKALDLGMMTTVNGFRTTAGAWGLVAADFDGDKKLDLALGDNGGTPNLISLRYGNGDGSFQPVSPTGGFMLGATAFALLGGDLDKDGRPDLLAMTYNGTNNDESRLLFNGGGRGDLSIKPVPYGRYPLSVQIGDFSGDGEADLLVASLTGDIHLTRGLGQRMYAAPQQVLSGSAATMANDLTSGDYDGDGKRDYVLADDSGALRIGMGSGGGQFQAPRTLALAGAPELVGSADVNDDGKLDLLVSQRMGGSYSLLLLLGQGNGGFAAPVGEALLASPSQIAVADAGGDSARPA